MIKTIRKPRLEALLQILILVIGLVAFSYAVGGGLGIVSAADDTPSCPTTLNPKSCSDNSECGDCCDKTFLESVGICKIIPPLNGTNCDYSTFTSRQVEGKCGYTKLDTDTSGDEPGIIDKGKDLAKNVGKGIIADKTYEEVKNLAKNNIKSPTKTGSVPIPSKDLGIFGSEEALEEYILAEEEALGEFIEAGFELPEAKLIGWKAKLKNWLFGDKGLFKWNNKNQGLGQAAVWAGIIYTGITVINWIVGDEEWSAFLSQVAGDAALGYLGTYLVGKALVLAGKTLGVEALGSIGAALTVPIAGWIAAGGIILFELFTFKTEKQQLVTFQCMPWQAPKGGDDCEKCNNQGLIPCSEYQCKSLGQACDLINQGTSNQKCILSKDDGKYPTIEPWQDALLGNDYFYTPVSVMAPPDKGVYVKYTESSDGCIPAFTRLSFGVSLDENAQCKISSTRESSYEEMDSNKLLSGGLANESHYFQLPLVGANTLTANNISIPNGGEYELFVRCEDYHGHSNPANFVFKFCIDEGPDHTSPNVEIASPLNGMPIANNQESVESTFYINEPAECKWSRLDKDYDNMENTMSCATGLTEMNAYMFYPCTTTLTGLENNKENKFYVRCKDQPELTGDEAGNRNINVESYEYTLIGTDALILDWVTPNNTLIKGPTSSVTVKIEAETSAGYDDGISTCYYSETGDDGSYVQFYETASYEHSQELWLGEGEYEYHIKCVDLGGNTGTATINFDVETDITPPIIARVYREGEYLKLITDEEAECRYGTSSNVGCNYNFEEGTLMTSTNDLKHYVDWNSNVNFYIKCGETREGGLYPPQNECSLIVRPFDIYS